MSHLFSGVADANHVLTNVFAIESVLESNALNVGIALANGLLYGLAKRTDGNHTAAIG